MERVSPLGKYGQVVAAVVAVAIIVTYLFVLAVVPLFGIDPHPENVAALDKLAFAAFGAVFGAFAAVNGVKAPIDQAHARIDKLEFGTGIPTHGAFPVLPGTGFPEGTEIMIDGKRYRNVGNVWVVVP